MLKFETLKLILNSVMFFHFPASPSCLPDLTCDNSAVVSRKAEDAYPTGASCPYSWFLASSLAKGYDPSVKMSRADRNPWLAKIGF